MDGTSQHATRLSMNVGTFVQRDADLESLRTRLRRLGKPDPGIILKIETRRAFENLPELLFAALAGKAAGVMLNEGPFFDEAIRTLDDILRRMQGHQDKKRPLLRALKSWGKPQKPPAGGYTG